MDRDIVGGEDEVHKHRLCVVDSNMAGSGAVLEADKVVLEGVVLRKAVVNADSNGRVVDVLPSSR